MENLVLDQKLNFKQLLFKTFEVISKRSAVFITVLILLALPIGAVNAYVTHSTVQGVSEALATLDLNAITSAQNLPDLSGLYSVGDADIMLSLIAGALKIVVLLFSILLAYGYFIGGSPSKADISELLSITLRRFIGVLLLYIFYYVVNYMVIGMVSTAAAAFLAIVFSVQASVAVQLILLGFLGLAGIYVLLFLTTYVALYFYNMFICVAIGRCHMLFAFPYTRAVFSGQGKKAFYMLMPWILLSYIVQAVFFACGYFTISINSYLSYACFGAGAVLGIVLLSLMFVFSTAHFFNLESNSKVIIRINKKNNGSNDGSSDV